VSYSKINQSRVSCTYRLPVQKDSAKLQLFEIKRIDLDAL